MLDRLPPFPNPLSEPPSRLDVNDDDVAAYLAAFASPKSNAGAGGVKAQAYFDSLFGASWPLFTVAAYCGLSRRDIIHLRWCDVNFDDGEISGARHKTGVRYVVEMAPEVIVALNEMKSRAVVSAEFVFVTPDGKRYHPTTIRRYHVRALEIAGISKRFTFHQLRHLYGTRLAANGASATAIKESMGHASIVTSQKYIHSNRTPDMRARLRDASRLNVTLKSGSG
jgi:integrase